jgi:hypothetical protein
MKTNDSPRSKKPWPTKDAMVQVYEKNLWGGSESEFYSGEGSHAPYIVQPYIDSISLFLNSFDQPLTICDLGCGDFNVGKDLVKYTRQYLALDIVPELIAHNQLKFKLENLEFRCVDIAADSLPSADCVIARQVLQHLSNAEVQQVLNKLISFKYIILTEHIPHEPFEPNKDIISGQGTRLKKQSGLDLTAAPFHFKMKHKKVLTSIALGDEKGVIETILYTMD